MEEHSQSATLDSLKYHQKPWFRLCVFFVFLADIILILYFRTKHPEVSDPIWLTASEIATGVVTLMKSLELVKGSSGKSRSIDELFGDPYVQVIVGVFTLAAVTVNINQEFVMPKKFTLSVYVKPVTSRDSLQWAGEAILTQSVGKEHVQQVQRKAVQFAVLEPLGSVVEGTKYVLEYRFHDPLLFFAPDSFESRDVPGSDWTDTVHAEYRMYRVAYSIIPAGAQLTVHNSVLGSTNRISQNQKLELPKGLHEYVVEADPTIFESQGGSFYVPGESLRVELPRRSIRVSFYANRGLGKELRVPARFTIRRGALVVQSDVPSGEWVYLPAGNDYVVEAMAMYPFDLMKRTYTRTLTNLRIAREDGGHEIRVPVQEQEFIIPDNP